MASISNSDGLKCVQFVDDAGKRRTIRLGRVSQRTVETVRIRVEGLLAARRDRTVVDNDTAAWLRKIGDDLARKLAAVGLAAPRDKVTLDQFVNEFIHSRADVKEATRRNLDQARRYLERHFGAEKPLADVTADDAARWLAWMKQEYARATVGRRLKDVRRFFAVAMERNLIGHNPFASCKASDQPDPAKKRFIDRDTTAKLMEAAPDLQWRLIIALSRFGGLRCPSETLALKWGDVNWERNRLWVTSPKTEHHPGREGRWLPLFPELRPMLEEAFDAAEPGAIHVVTRSRDATVNLRTQLLRIIRHAGLTPWPKPFHNLRASRETELAGEYPLHVVTEWIGNTSLVALKHYLTVTDSDFTRAAGALQNPVQQAHAMVRTEKQVFSEPSGIAGECETTRPPAMPCKSDYYARQESNL